MGYVWQSRELICWDGIHPTQYVFFEETETGSPVYTTYVPDYAQFYDAAAADIEAARERIRLT